MSRFIIIYRGNDISKIAIEYYMNTMKRSFLNPQLIFVYMYMCIPIAVYKLDTNQN